MERWEKTGIGRCNNTRIVFLVLGSALLLVLGAALQVLYAEVNVKARVADLKSKNVKTRIAAALELGRGKKSEASGDLIRALGQEKNAEVRMHGVAALGSMEGEPARAELRSRAVNDPSHDVRAQSCLALGKVHDASVVPLLAGIALDRNEQETVRLSAVSSLSFHLGVENAEKTLEQIISRENGTLVFGTVNCLRHTRQTKAGARLLELAAKRPEKDISALSGEILGKGEK